MDESGNGGLDTDNDGKVDGPDADGDGINDGADSNPGNFGDANNPAEPDTDKDGKEDYRDPDDDGDTIPTKYENPDPTGDHNPNDAQDTDKDGKPDYLDTDDDGDTVPTAEESPDLNKDGNPVDAINTDNDDKPNYLDPDDDNDKVLTKDEQPDPNEDGKPSDAIDTDEDSTPDYLDPDSRPADPDNPKPVTLISFRATWGADGVVIEWRTSAELNTFGFRLYRSQTDQRADAVLVTPQSLPSLGVFGGHYSFTDRTAQAGVTYTYWLEEMTLEDKASDIDFTTALFVNARIFLPLINR